VWAGPVGQKPAGESKQSRVDTPTEIMSDSDGSDVSYEEIEVEVTDSEAEDDSEEGEEREDVN